MLDAFFLFDTIKHIKQKNCRVLSDQADHRKNRMMCGHVMRARPGKNPTAQTDRQNPPRDMVPSDRNFAPLKRNIK